MVLYRAEPHRILESLRERAREFGCMVAQRVCRGWKARKFVRMLFAVKKVLVAAIASRDLDKVTAAIAVSC